MNDEPLIYTSLGNIPERMTRYEHEWVNGPEVLVFHERWYHVETGELIKNSMHGYVKSGLSMGGAQAVM